MKYWKLFTGVVLGVIGFLLYKKYADKNNNAQALPVDVVKDDIKVTETKIEEVKEQKEKVEEVKQEIKEDIKKSKKKSSEIKEQIAAVETEPVQDTVDADEAAEYLKKFSKKQ